MYIISLVATGNKDNKDVYITQSYRKENGAPDAK